MQAIAPSLGINGGRAAPMRLRAPPRDDVSRVCTGSGRRCSQGPTKATGRKPREGAAA